MTVQEIDLPMPDGPCDAFLALPEDPGPHPGVLFIMDAIGLRPRIAQMAQRIADWGFAVLAPNHFWRDGRQPLIDPELLTAERAPARHKAMGELIAALTPALWAADGPVYLDQLAQVARVTDAPTRVVGYCMGGRLGVALAAQCPDRVGVVAGFHPGGLVTDSPQSPHQLLPKVRARLYFGYADADPSMPIDAQDTFAAAAADAGCDFRGELYSGAAHGYTMADLPAYSAEAEARHWHELARVFAD